MDASRRLRDPFDDGLFAEAGASRIPTSHDLTLGYTRKFGLTLIPFEPVSVPSIRYAYRQRSRIEPGGPFEWPSGIPANQKRLTPAEVRRRYILRSSTRSPSPSRPHGCRSLFRQYDRVTRDEYLRAQGVSEAALHMMNLGYTPVARFRSFLDVLHENAVYRELSRRAGAEDEQILKSTEATIGFRVRSPTAWATASNMDARFTESNTTRTPCACFSGTGQSVESAEAGYLVCAVPFSTLRSVAFSPALRSEKRSVIDALPYESVTRIYLQSRDRVLDARRAQRLC